MRLVLDTNTAISGLLWHGTPGKLIDAAHSKSVLLCTSAVLLSELRGVLTREKFAKQLASRGLNAIEIFNGYAALTTIVAPAIIGPTITTTPPTMRCSRVRSGRRPSSSFPATGTCSISMNTKAFGL